MGKEPELKPSLSESTDGGVEVGSVTLQLCKWLVDDWVLVKDADIESATLEIAESQKQIVEGAAALAYAGCLQFLREKKVRIGVMK